MSGSDVKMSATSALSNDVTIGDVSTLLNDILTNIEQKKETNEIIFNDNTVIPTNKKRKAVPENVSAKSTKVNSSLNFNSILGGLFTNANNLLDKFKGHYETLNASYNNIINGTRNALTTAANDLTTAANDAKEVAIPIIKSIHEDINIIREQGLVGLSNAYDVYLQAMTIQERVKEGLGFQTIDTIILEHEKMACIALLELVYDDGKGTFIDLNTTNIGDLITQAMTPGRDGKYTDKQQQVRTHIEMAVKVYFIFKHGKSAVEDMSIIASKGINYGDLDVAARSNRGLNEQYLIDSHNEIVNNILNNPDERNAFLTNVVNNILTDPVNPSIDHSKYYGTAVTADEFIHNKFSDIRIPINSLETQYDFYITGRANTGNSIRTKYIPRLNRIRIELDVITTDLIKQKLDFPGANINRKITTQLGQLQTKIINLREKMNEKLESIAGKKEEGGGKKTRRRKATSSRRVSLRKRKSKKDKRSNQSKGTLKKKHSKKHKA